MKGNKTSVGKKVLSMMLALIMLFSISGLTLAAEMPSQEFPAYSDSKADVYYEFLGTSPAGTNLGELSDLPSNNDVSQFTWEKDGYVWIGVYFANMTRLATDMFASGGATNVTLSLAFDSNYFSYNTADATEIFRYINGEYEEYLNHPVTTYPYTSGRQVKPHYSAAGQLSDLTTDAIANEYNYYGKLQLTNTNTDQIGTARAVMKYDTALGDVQKIFNGEDYLKDEKTLVGLFALKMTADNAPTGNPKVLEGLFGAAPFLINVGDDTYSFNLGTSAEADTNLSNKFNIVQGLVDLFPAGQVTPNGIASSGSLATQYTERGLNKTGITIEYTYSAEDVASAPTDKTVDSTKIKWYTAAANDIDSASASGLTEVTGNLTAADNGKYLYAVETEKNFITLVGQLNVQALAIATITAVNFTDEATGKDVIADENILTSFKAGGDLAVSPATEVTLAGTYNSGEAFTALGFTDATTKYDMALYTVTGTGSDEYTAVDADDTYMHGVNAFVIGSIGASGATAPTISSPKFNVDAKFNTISLTKKTAPKLSYLEGDKIDLTGLEVTMTKLVGGSADVGLAQLEGKGLVVKVAPTGSSAAVAHNSGIAVTDGDTEILATWLGAYDIFVIHGSGACDESGSHTVGPVAVSLGTIGGKEVASATISDLDVEATYGEALGDAMKVKLIYDDDSDSGEIAYNDFATNGITLKINGEVVDKDTVLDPTKHAGKKLEIYIGDDKIGEAGTAFTVAKKTIKVKAASGITSVTKVYDGTADVKEALMASDLSGSEDLLAADATDAAKLKATGITFSYPDKDADAAPGAVNYTVTALTAAAVDAADAAVATDFNAKYTLELSSDFTATNATTGTLANITGQITKRTITVKDTTNFQIPGQTVDTAASADFVGKSSVVLNKDNTTYNTTEEGIVGSETVELVYQFTYAANDLKSEGTPTVAIVTSGKYSGDGTTDLGLSGTGAGNYELVSAPATRPGSVVNQKITALEIVTAPTKASYTYPNLGLDLTGMEIKVTFEGGATDTVSAADFIASLGTISTTDKNGQTASVTAGNLTNVCDLAYGTTAVTATTTLGDNVTPASVNVTAAKKTINMADITATGVSKTYGETDVTGAISYTAETGDTIVLVPTYVFTDENAGTDKEVTITFTIDEEASTGEENYVLEDSAKVITDGVINKAVEATPEAPVIALDATRLTNDITVISPLGTDLVYSIDGGLTWQAETVFTGLDKATAYKVIAKRPARDAANWDDSAQSAESNEVTTYAYYVKVLKTNDNSGQILASIYTNDLATAMSDAQVNSGGNIFNAAPSRFSSYYQDVTGTTKVVYPISTNTTVLDATGTATLYMKQRTLSGGGGGGAATTYDVTYTIGEGGTAKEGDKLSEKVAKNSKPASAPEIEANEGFTFIGWSIDGETIVDPTTVAIKEDTVFIAVYEGEAPATEEPKPEDKPIINTKYLKPYAKGYEDGSFAADGLITRAELSAMIARLSFGDELPEGNYDTPFEDVAEDAWYAKYIAYCYDNGVITGYEDGTFQPNKPVSRGEMAAIIVRAQRYEVVRIFGMFQDIEYDWAQDYITTLAGLGIVEGYDSADGKVYMPLNSITRGETVTIINRVLDPSEAIVTFVPNDIDGHWAYAEIILATNERKLLNEEATEAPEEEATEAPAEEDAEAPVEEATEAPAEDDAEAPAEDENAPAEDENAPAEDDAENTEEVADLAKNDTEVKGDKEAEEDADADAEADAEADTDAEADASAEDAAQ